MKLPIYNPELNPGDVQRIMLKAILENGGTANTNDIIRITGRNRMPIVRSMRYLYLRGLITIERPKMNVGYFGRKLNIYTLKPNRLEKIKRLISQLNVNK